MSATLLLGQHRVAALIDSGASHTLVASSLRDRLGLVPDGPWSIPLASASGNDMGITTSRLLALGFGTHVVHWRCGVASGLPLPLLIGADLLSSQRCALDLGALRLRFPAAPPVPLSISAAAPALAASCLPTAAHLLLARDTVIPGRSEVVVSAMVPASSRPPVVAMSRLGQVNQLEGFCTLKKKTFYKSSSPKTTTLRLTMTILL